MSSKSVTLTGVDNGSKSVTLTTVHLPDDAPIGTAFVILGSRWLSSTAFDDWSMLGSLPYDGTPMSLVLSTVLPSYGGWFFLAQVITEDLVSNPLYLPVVDASLSLFTQCEEAVAATIKLLDLPEIGQRVYTQLVPHNTLVTYPCVFVASNEGVEKLDEALAGTNSFSNVGHPVRVIMADRINLNQDEIRAKFARWRQTIRRAFDKVRLAGVPSCPWATVEFGPRWQVVIYPTDQGTTPNAYEIVSSTLTVRCTTREPRGFLV